MPIQVAEFVGRGHPDKIADTIADRLLEALLAQDLEAQFACEVLASKGLIVVAGERSGQMREKLDVEGAVMEVLSELGYNPNEFKVIDNMKEQSLDIRSTSVKSLRGIVSGDQSVVVGYASRDTENFLPLSFDVARSLIRRLEECLEDGTIKGAFRDCKSMVILRGREVVQMVLSVQHSEDVDLAMFRGDLYSCVVECVVQKYGLTMDAESVFINSSEKFVIGGLDADTGMTNRKLMVDSYGLQSRHGGGGYSGKDLTKVDRSGAYYARWICKNLVAAGVCESIELQLIFRYGSSKPLVHIRECVSECDREKLLTCIEKVFDLSFEEVYRNFNVPDIKYSLLACYGHFGHRDMPWEKLNKVEEIRAHLNED